MGVAELLSRELEKERAAAAAKLARTRHSEEVFSDISEQQKAIAHQHNLTPEALNSLLEHPEMYSRYVELTKQNG